MKSAVLAATAFAMLLCGANRGLLAQVPQARMQGIVRDSSQAVIPGATVTVTNIETGIRRSTTTDGQGRYAFNDLNPARYELSCTSAGFKNMVRSGITLTVGAEISMDVAMEVGGVAEQVTVMEEVPLVETRSGTVGGVVEEKEIKDLPLNGRSFADLVQLTPGVITTRAATANMLSGLGDKMSLGGARPSQMGFLLDGADMMSRNNTTPSGASGIMLGVDAIQEFRVSTSSSSAEFGRNSGGVVSAITKSGTNEFHGSAFEFLRNSALDARNFFDKAAPPPFKRNQFGGTVGGPFRKDKAFFFLSYEGLRQNLGLSGVDSVPDDSARRGILPTGAVQIAPIVVPYLNLYPVPNGPSLGGGISRYFWSGSNTTRQDSFVTRVDHQLSSTDSLMGRVFFDDSSLQNPTSMGLVQNFTGTRIQSYVISYNKLMSASAVNTARVSFQREHDAVTDAVSPEMNKLAYIPGLGYGSLTQNGFSSISTNSSGPQYWSQNSFQYNDDAIITRGSHTMRLGALVQRFQYNSLNVGRLRGEYQFPTLTAFLTGTPSRYEAGHLNEGIRGIRQWMFGMYFQDDWKATRRLTLNLGVRYEFTTVAREVNGRISQLRHQTDPQVTLGDPWWINPSLKNFAPRVGFAYDATGDGKTSVRGGFGIYYDQLLSFYYRDEANRILPYTQRFLALSTSGPLPFPNAIDLFASSIGKQELSNPNNFPELMPYEPNQPYTMQYSFTVQRQLSSNFSVMLGYLGSGSRHNSMGINWNICPPTAIVNGQKFFATGCQRINPNFSTVFQLKMDGTANYNSLQVQVKKRVSHGLDFNMVYQWARTMDEISGRAGSTDFGNTTSFLMDPTDWKRDYGRAAFDIRHYVVANLTYQLPEYFSGWKGKALDGWKLSSITSYSSGEPFTVANGFDRATPQQVYGFQERPNVTPGRSNNPIIGDPNRWYDPNAFQLQPAGFYGNLGRNTLQGPNLIAEDLSLAKDFTVTEKNRFQFRWEVFNALNRANFGTPAITAFLSATAVNANAGRITTTRTSSRQMQLALKFIF